MGEKLPKYKLYFMSRVEEEELWKYIGGKIVRGFFSPVTSLHAASYNVCEEKGWGTFVQRL